MKNILILKIAILISLFLTSISCSKEEVREPIRIEVLESVLDTLNRTIYITIVNNNPFDLFIPADHLSYSDFINDSYIRVLYEKTTFPVFQIDFKNRGFAGLATYYFYEDYNPLFLKIIKYSSITIPIRLKNNSSFTKYKNKYLRYYIPLYRTEGLKNFLTDIYRKKDIDYNDILVTVDDIEVLKDSFNQEGKEYNPGGSIKIGNDISIDYSELVESFVENIDTVVSGRTEIQVSDD